MKCVAIIYKHDTIASFPGLFVACGAEKWGELNWYVSSHEQHDRQIAKIHIVPPQFNLKTENVKFHILFNQLCVQCLVGVLFAPN